MVTVAHPWIAVVACVVWCLVCCAFAWWSGGKRGRKWTIDSFLDLIEKRDSEWNKLLAMRIAQRDREWIQLVEDAQRTGRRIGKRP